ncbi:uncharacterized protein [Bemisia tabaci]|uniref:uncharacterized protein n=1 Tax=Bemisia tabaci TaxID=7038 RepID=UPI003B287DA5
MPFIQATLDKLKGAKVMSKLDLKDGYWHIPLAESSKQYSAFTVPGRGLFEWNFMPQGLHSAPATFQRLIDNALGPECDDFAVKFLDDIFILSPNLSTHKEHLRLIFSKLKEAGLTLNMDKCDFGCTELKYLGHLKTTDGIKPEPYKVEPSIVLVQLLHLATSFEIPYIQCYVQKTTFVKGCGKLADYTWSYKGGFRGEIVTLSKTQCEQLNKTRTYDLKGDRELKVELEDTEYTGHYITAGSLNARGDCSGASYSFNGYEYDDAVAEVHLKVRISSGSGQYVKETGKISLESGYEALYNERKISSASETEYAGYGCLVMTPWTQQQHGIAADAYTLPDLSFFTWTPLRGGKSII